MRRGQGLVYPFGTEELRYAGRVVSTKRVLGMKSDHQFVAASPGGGAVKYGVFVGNVGRCVISRGVRCG